MPSPLLATKLFVPQTRRPTVHRTRLIERLNEGLTKKLVVVCAPAGFGKTTLLCDWISRSTSPAAWLSLDQEDREAASFLNYLVAALQSISPTLGASLSPVLQSSSRPSLEELLPLLVNDIAQYAEDFLVVLDDYHLVANSEVDKALEFLLDQPTSMHLALTTREDPRFPVSRLRARGEIVEIRQDDLRFDRFESTDFFLHSMKLELKDEQVSLLTDRTEGWIAGLQLAAISLQSHGDVGRLIRAFAGTNRFVQDYLLEEVLNKQSEEVHNFLLRTSVLDRLSAPLCDAVLISKESRATIEYLEQTNLFIAALDDERRWFRYHALFAELLRKRLKDKEDVSIYHLRASGWYEDQGMEIEAFQQAAWAGDIDRSIRLMEGGGIPLFFRGVTTPVLSWLSSLSKDIFVSYPSLAIDWAWALVLSGRALQGQQQLEVSRTFLPPLGSEGRSDALWGRVFALQSLLATAFNQVDSIIPLAKQALELLDEKDSALVNAAQCSLGVGLQYRGDRSDAEKVFSQLVRTTRNSGNMIFHVAGSIALAHLLETENRLRSATEIYLSVLETVADPSLILNCEAYLGLARISYEKNDLESASVYVQLGAKLAGQLECDMALIAQGIQAKILGANQDPGAEDLLSKAMEVAVRRGLDQRARELAELQIAYRLRRGQVAAAKGLAESHRLPIGQARVFLHQGHASAAVKLLESWLQNSDSKTRPDERFQVLVLLAVALHCNSEPEKALTVIQECFETAEGESMVRSFLDEGEAAQALLKRAQERKETARYAILLLQAFDSEALRVSSVKQSDTHALSERELDVLRLMTQGLSNQQIGEKLFLSLSTVKWHNQNIFSKLNVQRRTEAILKARESHLV